MDYPRSEPGIGLLNGKFTDGNPSTGLMPSRDTASWANAVTDEILNVQLAAGIAPDETQHDQLLIAIQALIGLRLGEVAADVGDIKKTACRTAPAGWLECNGVAHPIATYAALDAAIYVGDVLNATADWGYRCTDPNSPNLSRSVHGTHIVVPDHRAHFSCGLDNGAGIDLNRPFASAQASQNAAHTHEVVMSEGGAHTHIGNASSAGTHVHSVSGSTDYAGEHVHGMTGASGTGAHNYVAFQDAPSSIINTNAAGTHAHAITGNAASAGAHIHDISIAATADHTHAVVVGSEGGVEARPRNLAFLYVIKY